MCIDAFIRLHPKLRRGVELTKDDVAKATRNYHTKIEWLDKYVEEKHLSLEFSFEEIVWYHSLRNELYHSGNGMVPEMHVLESVRSAALGVFFTLFGADLSLLLGGDAAKREVRSDRSLVPADKDTMELLRLFIEFERALQEALVKSRRNIGVRNVMDMWKRYSAFAQTPPKWNAVVRKASDLRNLIVHGHDEKVSSDEVVETYLQLMEITDALKSSKK